MVVKFKFYRLTAGAHLDEEVN